MAYNTASEKSASSKYRDNSIGHVMLGANGRRLASDIAGADGRASGSASLHR